MGIFDGLRDWMLAPIVARMNIEDRTRLGEIGQARAYRLGEQPDSLTVAAGQADDNIVLNYVGLAVDRSVSLLFGNGVKFNLPGEGETEQGRYLAATMDANKQQILLHRVALMGCEAGTCYLWMVPSGVIGRDGKEYTRLVAVNPEYVTIETEPEDTEIVRRYVVQYPTKDAAGKPAVRKKVIQPTEGGSWETVDTLLSEGVEMVLGTDAWPYDFPPMLHWQNLPSVGSAYGRADITADVIRLQRRINGAASNINKIIRLYAFPMRFSRMMGMTDEVVIGPDRMLNFEDPAGGVFQLEPLGDLAAAMDFYDRLERSIFAVTRTIDPSSLEKRTGDLTNFGLRVMFQDALQKLGTKRELYGDALLELARRLLVIGSFADTDPGKIEWPEALPESEMEIIQGLGFDLSNKLASRQTAAQKRGYDWEEESKRIKKEAAGQANELALALIERERAARERFDRGDDAPETLAGRSGSEVENER